ncbi:MAG: hypothetical protein ACI4A3_02560 [Lachnospiraceae bacterium]
MTKQKKGFWLFIASLIPGAGELYMGFRKMGLSIMILFFGTIACTSFLNLDALIFLLPIIWFYSFFNVHNIKSLSEEEFLSMEDDYLVHLDTFITDKKSLVSKYRNVIAFLLILFGISGIWSSLTSWLGGLIPERIYQYVYDLGYQLPSFVISILLVIIGIKLIKGKREELDQNENA